MSTTSGGIELAPGYSPDPNGETITWDKIQAMNRDAVLRVMEGAIGPREIANNSITADQLATDLSAQIGVPAGSVTLTKLAAGFLLPIAQGGTGAATAAAARVSLGVTSRVVYLDAEVKGGAGAPVLYQDLNLTLLTDGLTASGVPAERCMVFLKVTNNSTTQPTKVFFKTKGDANISETGVSFVTLGTEGIAYVQALTDADGLLEWKANLPTVITVDVLCYQQVEEA
jgi:hypothetical protein